MARLEHAQHSTAQRAAGQPQQSDKGGEADIEADNQSSYYCQWQRRKSAHMPWVYLRCYTHPPPHHQPA